MDPFAELRSMLELCFGDADDAEGLADLRLQLSIYTDRARDFRSQLDALIVSGDGVAARGIVTDTVHIDVTPVEALDWLRWLQAELARA